MEWWNLWVPFLGTLISALIGIYSNFKQRKSSENFERKFRVQQQEFEESLIYQQNEIAKKNDIRKSSALFLRQIESCLQIVREFIENRRKLEDAQNVLSNLIKDNINPEHVIGYDVRGDISKLDKKLTELKHNWENSTKDLEQISLEVLLHLDPSKEENKSIDSLTNDIVSSILGLNVLFNSNLPEDMLLKMINLDKIYKIKNDLTDDIRKLTNN